MFGSRCYGFPNMHRLHRLNRLHRRGGPIWRATAFADSFHRGPWRPVRRYRSGPSFLRLLAAGLAVFAFMKLWNASNNGERTTAEKVVLGGLLLFVGAVVLSFRRNRESW